jgi:N-acetylmuramoyl-L-alanine amidase
MRVNGGLVRALLAGCALLLVSSLLASAGGDAVRLAHHADGDFTRVVLEAPGNRTYAASASGTTLTVRLEPFAGARQAGAGNTAQVASWSLEPKPGYGVLRLQTRARLDARDFTVFRLPAGDGLPPRIVADIRTPGSRALGPPPAPRPPVSTRAPQRPRPVVVLDPGHGGIDPGGVAFVTEKETALDVAKKVRTLLEAAGVRVVMTRTGDAAWQGVGGCDKGCDLDRRADLGSTDRNAFVSIHVNAATNPKAQGAMTFLFGQAPDRETLAQAQRENGGGASGRALTTRAGEVARGLLNDQLAQLNASFSRRLATGIQRNLIAQTGAVDQGVKQAEFWVISRARIPAVLVEMGFATHPEEGRRLGTPAYRQRIAAGIARGTLAFLGL